MKPSQSILALADSIAALHPNVMRGAQIQFFSQQSVTQTQFLVILAIHSFGQCSMQPLADNYDVTLPTMTGIIDRLVRAGFVKRVLSADDRRKVWITLTTKGNAFVESYRKTVSTRWQTVVAVLDDQDVRDFQRIVDKMQSQFQGKPRE